MLYLSVDVVKKLAKDKNILGQIREIILEVEAAESIVAIGNLKKTQKVTFSRCYPDSV